MCTVNRRGPPSLLRSFGEASCIDPPHRQTGIGVDARHFMKRSLHDIGWNARVIHHLQVDRRGLPGFTSIRYADAHRHNGCDHPPLHWWIH